MATRRFRAGANAAPALGKRIRNGETVSIDDSDLWAYEPLIKLGILREVDALGQYIEEPVDGEPAPPDDEVEDAPIVIDDEPIDDEPIDDEPIDAGDAPVEA